MAVFMASCPLGKIKKYRLKMPTISEVRYITEKLYEADLQLRNNSSIVILLTRPISSLYPVSMLQIVVCNTVLFQHRYHVYDWESYLVLAY